MIRSLARKIYGRFCRLAKGLALAVVLVLFALPARAGEPVETITEFHDKLLNTMQHANEWNFEERREYLAPAVKETFNTRVMMRLAASSFWNLFSEEQKESLVKAFYDFTVSTYASRFKGYSGQEFEIVDEQDLKGGRVLVSTNLVKSNGGKIAINYVMMPDDQGDYQVIDVFLEGKVSELSLRRSEFSPILRDKGFTGLVGLLKTKVETLEAEAFGAS